MLLSSFFRFYFATDEMLAFFRVFTLALHPEDPFDLHDLRPRPTAVLDWTAAGDPFLSRELQSGWGGHCMHAFLCFFAPRDAFSSPLALSIITL